MRFPPDLRPEDDAHRQRLEGVPVRPVFIMGLHRSGTTFLYETLARVLPLAAVTAYHVLFYPRLLSRQAAGTAEADKRLLEETLAAAGLATRQIDEIALSADTVEEYGWLLSLHGRGLTFGPETADLLDELCRKLAVLEPESRAVLLKSPWDTGNASALLGRFPESRFVFIRRDPLRILDSQLRSGLVFGAEPAPYLDLLIQRSRGLRVQLGLQRLLYRLAGERRYAGVILRFLMSDIAAQLAAYRRELQALPAERAVELSYDELTRDPRATLQRVADFLEVAPVRPLDEVQPRPRGKPLHPDVERVREPFLARLRRAGLTELIPEEVA